MTDHALHHPDLLSHWHVLLPTPLIVCRSEDGGVLYANRAAEALLPGITRLPSLGDAFVEAEEWGILLEQLREQGEVLQQELEMATPGHEPAWVLLAAHEIRQGDDRLLIVSLHDLTERRRRESQLKSREELHRHILAATREGYVQIDPDTHRILDANPAFCELVGRPRSRLTGKPLREFLAADSPNRNWFTEPWRRQGTALSGELTLRHAEGQPLPVHANIDLLPAAEGQPPIAFALLTDIRDRKRVEERMYALAFFDPLTALPNRLLFEERLQQAIRQQRRHGIGFALLFIDLDNFKGINDTLGHDVGDRMLQEIARRLFGAVRDSDTVARLGGDEFVVLLIGTDDAVTAARLADKLLAALQPPVMVAGKSLPAGASIGIALAPRDGQDATTLKRRADVAMYQAKAAGKHTYRFYKPGSDPAPELSE